MNKIKQQIPNAITLLNLLFGCFAMVALWKEAYVAVYGWVALALLADLLDGAFARLLNVTSEIGKQLDSLADMVSFGLVPGLFFYKMLEQAGTWAFLPYAGFLVTLFSAIRLARFNQDERQAYSFFGLPSPANAIWILGLFWYVEWGFAEWTGFFRQAWFLLFSLALSCFLLIADIRMFSFKFKSLQWKGQEIKTIFIFLSLILLAIFRGASIYWIICLYVILSLLIHYKRSFKT
jgi:CDP-diacylglycerol--serine O-phosphatidyltransferase